MILGILTVDLEIDHAKSLKDKRAVLNRVKDRVRKKFNVSIAEIEGNEVWNYACLGVVIVSNEQRFCNQVLSKVVELMDEIRDCELGEFCMEFIHAQ
jgi:hypothetical protein